MAIKTFFSSTGSSVKRAAFVALLGAMSSMLVSCGGSGTASTTPTVPPTPPVIALGVLPASADIFPGLPFDIAIAGGTAPYTVGTSNAVVLAAPTVTGSTTTGFKITVVANSVIADTPVTLTIRDSLGATVSLSLNVKATTLNNTVTITPVAPTGTGCAGLCSGGDAQVDVTAQLNGIKLVNRPIRFDVLQGDFRFVTPATGAQVTSIIVNTDENGVARVRIQALVAAPTQVAILTSTDTVTGLVRRTNFVIAQVTSGVGILSILPSGGVTFTGAKPPPVQGPALPNAAQCPFGGIIDHYIYGGTPPYQIVSPLPQYLSVFPSTVTTNGGSYRVTQAGCGVATLVVTDAQNRAIESPTVTSGVGPAGDVGPAPVVVAPSLTVSPTSHTLVCTRANLAAVPPTLGAGQSATSTLAGSGTYTATITTPGVPSGAFTVAPTTGTIGPGSAITFTRNARPTAIDTPSPTTITVNIVLGTITVPVTVTVPALCPQD